MGADRPLIFGPAYLDLVITLDRPLLAGGPVLDQSLPAGEMHPRDDGRLAVCGPTGDELLFLLPEAMRACAATYVLREPVLARVCGQATARIVTGEYAIEEMTRQLGGMGAGYAKALEGVLRMPLGGSDGRSDGVGREVLAFLAEQQIRTVPALIPDCESDTSLLLQSRWGDKLAIGVRQAMTRWLVSPEDHALAAKANALVFCGAPNVLMAAVLAEAPAVPVMCAPALRNVIDRSMPLASLAPRIDYLTLNALEWAQVAGAEEIRRRVPVITVTEGAQGSRVLLGDREIHLPAAPFSGPADTNRAGETYGSTFFRIVRRTCPDFRNITLEIAEYAARKAAEMAARQLAIRGFAFPPADY